MENEHKQEQKIISYDEFAKIDFRVVRILNAERVEKSDKLLRLEVDLGEVGKRQIIAGIGKAYAPEMLIGKDIVIVANLEPRMLMGLESQGMVLAAHDADGIPVLLSVGKDVPTGSKVN